ncbi:hypothetical protein MXB_4221 [Myxobolus squamalis]|nr:hypothetical protein MXB_4221 [Myxobolus squamalis]
MMTETQANSQGEVEICQEIENNPKEISSVPRCQILVQFTINKELDDPFINKNIESPYRLKEKRCWII